MTIAERVRELVNIAGETVTFRELTSAGYDPSTMKSTPAYTSHIAVASIRQFADSELTGLVQKGERVLRVGSLDLNPYVPKHNDKVVVLGEEFNIRNVIRLSAKGEDALYEVKISL